MYDENISGKWQNLTQCISVYTQRFESALAEILRYIKPLIYLFISMAKNDNGDEQQASEQISNHIHVYSCSCTVKNRT
jgi:hypothetical protein